MKLFKGRFHKDKGWELHPCEPPAWEEIKTPHVNSVLGNVWACDCGRRWQLTQLTRTVLNGGSSGRFVQINPHYEEILEMSEADEEMVRAWCEESSE